MADPAAIDAYLKGKGSPLAGLGSVFVAAGRKYGVDPRLTVSISGAESSFGKYLFGAHNAWGWGPGIPFGSWEEAISIVTKGLRRYYIDEGRNDPFAIGAKYAPASDGNDVTQWATNVSTFMKEQGANPGSAATKIVGGSTLPPVSGASTVPAVPAVSSGMPDLQLEPIIASGLQSNNPDLALRNLVTGLASYQPLPGIPPAVAPVAPVAPVGTTGPVVMPPPTDYKKWVNMRPGADRSGVKTQPGVFNIVARIAKTFGSPLTITTGSNHNQFVSDRPGVQSAHWLGRAADILYGHGTGPTNVDPALTRLGRAALVTAGMAPREAAKYSGGVFNQGGYQILFNTTRGGNHYNHLHVGLIG